MKSIEIETKKGNTIEIYEQANGKIWISLPKDEKIKIEIRNVVIYGYSLVFDVKKLVASGIGKKLE